MAENNIILLTDSYKVSHYKQYPPKCEQVYSYFESRGGLHSEVCFFGLQYFVKKYLVGKVVSRKKIDEAAALYQDHFGFANFNREGWEYILEHHDGRLPIRIRALPEGTIIGTRNCLFTLENTDPKCFWLTNYLETLLVQVWYPMTVATNSREQKKVILHYLMQTGTPKEYAFKLNDFGFRGVSSVETAGLGAMAHLTQFLGTDTVAGLVAAQKYYGAKGAVGYSIPASEHSTMCSWGRAGEVDAMRNMLQQYPTGLVACVSDSYNIWNACESIWGKELKEMIMNREGTLVIRPDSGPPAQVDLGVLERLGKAFGTTVNEKGYKVLPKQVRMIQGDGIDFRSLTRICETLKQHGWSIDNIAFGSGGGLLQKMNRDTQKCAFKCSSVQVNGNAVDVRKSPLHDQGKASKGGRMTVNRRGGALVTLCGSDRDEKTDIMRTIFEDGELIVDDSWKAVLNRCSLDENGMIEEQYDQQVKTLATEVMSEYRGSAQEAKDEAIMRATEGKKDGRAPQGTLRKHERKREAEIKVAPIPNAILTLLFIAEMIGVLWTFRGDRSLLMQIVLGTLGGIILIKIMRAISMFLARNFSALLLSGEPFNNPLKRGSKNLVKFGDQSWQLFVHVVCSILGTMAMDGETWWDDPLTIWGPILPPDQEVKPILRLAYVAALCIWFATCISHVWIEEKHKDYFVMFIHHLVTIALVWGSWCFGYLRIGILVMYVHDFSDIFIDIMKLTNYAKLQGSSAFFIVEISFVSTLVSWFYIRLYVFPVKVIHSSYVHSVQWWFHNGEPNFDIVQDNWLAGKTVPLYWEMCLLLTVLFCLHIYWFYLLVMILVKIVTEGDAHQAGRETYEGESECSDIDELAKGKKLAKKHD